jgi:alpha-mannosidase
VIRDMLDIHVVSHTHWDREWYLTHEQFRFRLVALIDRLLDLLDANPSYKFFHLDGQTIVLEDYLEIRPEQEPRLRKAVESGRVLIGPWYVMPDEFLVSGESLVRNLMRGHRISRAFGTPMPVGYLPDLFGHIGQMPQIWRQFGLDNTILWRGFGGRDAEYWWEGPDGSRVLMMHLPPEGYCNATRIVFDPDEMMARAAEKVEFERRRTRTGQALLMNGVDHVEPHAAIPELIRRLSDIEGQRAAHSTLPAYVGAVRVAVERGRVPLETIAGELRSGSEYSNLLPGVLSARVYLKQQNARVQTLLESYAEPISVFALLASHGAGRDREYRYPHGELRHAWKTLLQNHPHDSICGCSIDAVHEENMTRFARAQQVAQAAIENALDALSDTVAPATAASTLRMLVVNPDGRERAQVVEATIELPIDSAEPWRKVDPQALDRPVVFWPEAATITAVATADRQPVPFQILGEERLVTHVMSRYETPWALNVRRIRLVLWAPAVPPCGYAAFDLTIADAASPATTAAASAANTIENERLRLSANADGTFELVDKATGRRYSRVAAFEDGGDVGDEYNYSPPVPDLVVTSTDANVLRTTRIVDGPLRAALQVDLEMSLPAAATSDRTRRSAERVKLPVTIVARVDRDSPRVVFDIALENRASDHRLRLRFPTGASEIHTARADTAFDIVTRSARVDVPGNIHNEMPVSSAPMISFVDAGDERSGATLIAKGLMEYEVVADADRNDLALTLLRAVGDLSRDDLRTRRGHAGPPVATPGAQCLGHHRFEVAFQPRGAAPAAGDLVAAARAHIVSPATVPVRRSDGTGPASRSFLHVDTEGGSAILSALKLAEERDTVIVRLFNPGDVDATVRLSLDGSIRAAHAVNFLEERQSAIAVDAGAAMLRLRPHQIQTAELER